MEILTREFVLGRGIKIMKHFNEDKRTARLILMPHSEKNVVAMVKHSFDDKYEKYIYYKNSFWVRRDIGDHISHPKIRYPKYYTANSAFEQWLKMIEEKEETFCCSGNINLLYIKPFFYETTGEPRYVINTFGFKNGTCVFVETHYNTNIMAERYFNAKDRKKAIELGKKIALRRGKDKFSIDGNIRILKSEYFNVNPIKQHTKVNEFSKKLQKVADSDMSPIMKQLWAFGEIGKSISDIAARKKK